MLALLERVFAVIGAVASGYVLGYVIGHAAARWRHRRWQQEQLSTPTSRLSSFLQAVHDLEHVAKPLTPVERARRESTRVH